MCENKSVYTHIVPAKPMKGIRLLNILASSVADAHVCPALIKIQMDCGNDSKQDWVNAYEALTLMIKSKKKRSPICSRKCLGDCWYPGDVVFSLSFSSISFPND